MLIARAVVYRNVERKASEAIARAHDDVKVVIAVFQSVLLPTPLARISPC